MTKVVRITQDQENRLDMLLRFKDSLTRIQMEIRRTEDSLRQVGEGTWARKMAGVVPRDW